MTRHDARPRRRLPPEQRRAAILAAAAEVFAESGWSHTTLGEIAARAESSEALVYRYFAGKDQLYGELVSGALADLRAARLEAVASQPPNTSTRDKIRAVVLVHLDAAAANTSGWAQPRRSTGPEPETVVPLRAAARDEFLDQLREWLPQHTVRHTFALVGFLGFLEAATLSWVADGCPGDELDSLLDAALGSLEGGLGDWGS